MTTAELADQRLTALRIGNERRTKAALLKRDLTAGSITLAEALASRDAQCVTIGQLLRAQARWGHQRAEQALRALALPGAKRAATLTDTQRADLGHLATLTRAQVAEWQRDKQDRWRVAAVVTSR